MQGLRCKKDEGICVECENKHDCRGYEACVSNKCEPLDCQNMGRYLISMYIIFGIINNSIRILSNILNKNTRGLSPNWKQ